MSKKEFDILVIGGGPGGYVAAIKSSQLGFKTAIVEKEKLGGVCLNWGCIPTKALLKNAEVYNYFKHSDEFGITHKELKFDFKKIIERSRNVAQINSKGIEYLMKKNKIEHISGSGKILGKNLVTISKDGKVVEEIKAKHIIIATGGRAKTIPTIKVDEKNVITSKTAMTLKTLPKSMTIIGAGAIGIEFAYFYNTFGTKVTLIEMLPNILPMEDKEISKLLESNFKKQGIEILTETKVENVVEGKKIKTVISNKSGKKEIESEIVLNAIGIQANIENIGLENVGIKIEKGFIVVDDFGKTNVDGIYAIGDVAGPPLLAHIASKEGIICVEKIAGKNPNPIDWENFPSCTYCEPQVASIGMTEEKAIQNGYKIKVGRFPFSASGKARAIGKTDGLVKLIFDEKYGELLGAHILGSEATEMIAELSVAKTLETTVEGIAHTIHAHPTLSEAIMEAAENAYGKSIHI